VKENGPNSGKRPPAGADNVTIDRNSEEAVFIGERTQKVVKLRRSLRSPEENIEVPPISARPEHCKLVKTECVCLHFFRIGIMMNA
jgi:hypothetical protein